MNTQSLSPTTPVDPLAHAGAAERLLILVPDDLSALVAKGEVTERYYNPGNLFHEVHLVTTNTTPVDEEELIATVGDARLVIHHLPLPRRFFWRSLGFRAFALQTWAKDAVALARQIKPQLVRCYGLNFNLVAGTAVSDALDVPLIVSLHSKPEQLIGANLKQRIQWLLLRPALKHAMGSVDVAVAVYESLIESLRQMGAKQIELAYNVVGESIPEKKNYTIDDSPHILSVGRLLPGKNPENLIRALLDVPKTRLTLVGDGPLLPFLKTLVTELDLADRVIFRRSLDNKDLCADLWRYDVFALHCDYWGIPKTVLEASLAGLPILVNRQNPQKIPEMAYDFCLQVENTPVGYARGLRQLLSNEKLRAEYGQCAREFAAIRWAPAAAECRYVDLYRSLLEHSAL